MQVERRAHPGADEVGIVLVILILLCECVGRGSQEGVFFAKELTRLWWGFLGTRVYLAVVCVGVEGFEGHSLCKRIGVLYGLWV
eukprot:1250188-Amorphochlora_amoeboformis.AAC.1